MKVHTIDADGRSLGRVATEAAVILMGKNDTVFQRNKVSGNKVEIQNVSKLDISGRKRAGKTYVSHSGYPGGLKKRSMDKVIEGKGYAEIMRKAVYGMLPANKLRKETMKNLEIKE